MRGIIGITENNNIQYIYFQQIQNRRVFFPKVIFNFENQNFRFSSEVVWIHRRRRSKLTGTSVTNFIGSSKQKIKGWRDHVWIILHHDYAYKHYRTQDLDKKNSIQVHDHANLYKNANHQKNKYWKSYLYLQIFN